jgi:hypothetical protein
LLLVVLSVCSESLQHALSPYSFDSTLVTVYPNGNSAQLGVLAPVLPQNEVFRIAPPQNGIFRTILPQNEVFKIAQPQNEVYRTILPQTEIFKIAQPQNEVYRTVLPQNEVFGPVLFQSEVFQIVLQSEMDTTVLPQNKVFKIVSVDCQWFNAIKTIINSLVNLKVNICIKLTSYLVYSGGKFCWVIRNFLECFQYALKMYTWSLSENQASVMFRCRLITLFLKQYLCKKHDFAVYLYKL